MLVERSTIFLKILSLDLVMHRLARIATDRSCRPFVPKETGLISARPAIAVWSAWVHPLVQRCDEIGSALATSLPPTAGSRRPAKAICLEH
jgi:hypothetical protein